MAWIRKSFITFSYGTSNGVLSISASCSTYPYTSMVHLGDGSEQLLLTAGNVIVGTSFLPWFSFCFYIVFINCFVGMRVCLF